MVLLTVIYSKFLKKENPVKLFGLSFLIVTTGSMEPEIKSGELILIKDVDIYKVGDVVTYLDQDDFLVTHRIIEVQGKDIITKGDNNDLNDEPTNLSSIKGKVVLHSRILGFFVLYLLKPLTIIYMIIILLIYLINVFSTKEKEDNNENKNSVQ